jgi:hypothetical protein
VTWTWRQTKQALARRDRARRQPLPPSAATPDGRPTRPDRLSIWPMDDERFGIDVLYLGAQGYRRADVVKRQIEELGLVAAMRQDGDGYVW